MCYRPDLALRQRGRTAAACAARSMAGASNCRGRVGRRRDQCDLRQLRWRCEHARRRGQPGRHSRPPCHSEPARDYALDHIAPLEREGDDGDRDGEGASIARSIAPGPGENGPASGGRIRGAGPRASARALHRRAFGAKRQLPSARGFEDRLAGLGPPPAIRAADAKPSPV